MKLTFKACLTVAASAFILYLAIHYWPGLAAFVGAIFGAAFPLVVGCIIAYIINILMSFFEKRYFPNAKKAALIRSRRPVCMLLSFVLLIAVIILLFVLVLPELTACVQLLIARIPGAVEYVVEWLRANAYVPEDILAPLLDVDWRSMLEQVIGLLTTGVGNVVGTALGLVTSVFSGIITTIFGIIFAVYILANKEKLRRQFDMVLNRYIKRSLYDKIKHVAGVINVSFRSYIVGQCTEALIMGAMCTIGMWILQLPYATMISAVVAFMALIPIAGAYISATVGTFMIFTVSPLQALIFLVFILVLQQVEGNIIAPKVVGSSIGLPGIWVLAAVTIGGGVFGVPGMLFGVPLAAALYRLLRQDIQKADLAGKQKQEAVADAIRNDSEQVPLD